MRPSQLTIAFDFDDLTVAPSIYPQARETSALAAIQIQPIRGERNLLLLQLLNEAGEIGLSDPEIVQLTGWCRAGTCARRFDCRSRIGPAATRFEANGRKYQRWKLA